MSATDMAHQVAAGDLSAVPAEALARWIAAQRWFASKARDITQFNVMQCVPLRSEPPVLAMALVEARFRAGTHELYQLLVGVRPSADEWHRGVIFDSGEWTVYEALGDDSEAALLSELLAGSAVLERDQATLRFCWREDVQAPGERPHTRIVGVEQSNSSVVFDERLVLKVFRRIEPGINPELEMLRFLSARAFSHIAELAGWYQYAGDVMEATLGVMQRFVTGAQDGWKLALESLRDGEDEAFLGRLHELGVVTGLLHTVLASDANDPDFAPEEPGDETLSLLMATIDEQIERVFLDLPDENPRLAPIAGRGEEVRDRLRLMSQVGVAGRLIRTHGDYHLGQALLAPEGWIVIDFEGEPGRPLVERRRKRSCLRDVAGMLRSFAYLASAGELLHGRPTPAGWEQRARERFLTGYLSTVDPTLLPPGQIAIDRLISVFELEKAVYELRYELNNRPDWVRVPVLGILRLLEGPLP